MKMLETSTASLSSPPPLLRRSSTTPWAPLASSSSIALRSSPCAPDVNPARRTCAILRPRDCSISASTTGTSTRARSSRMSRGDRLPETTESVTSVPDGPLISVVACSEVFPASERPSTAVITSPPRIPPRSAGESSNTVSTFRPRATSATFMPTPSNAPSVASWNSW